MGPESPPGKSTFDSGVDIRELLQAAEGIAPTAQKFGSLERTLDAGRRIGIEGSTGIPTSQYTVITDSLGNVITMFPGGPWR
jgi:hypothetical protein